MGLRGQGSGARRGWQAASDARGYAMAALLVSLAVMAILMSVAMPVWRQQARREKEAELVFRGEQYARAIALYNFKMSQQGGRGGLSLPPSIDVLVEGRYLRKKYKDPMTKDGEFLLIVAGQQVPGQGQTPPPGGRANQPQPQTPSFGAGGISGVRSKSEETSLRTYRGATRYDQWQFTFNTAPRPGGAVPMGGPGGGPPSTTGPRGGGPRGTGPGANPIGPGGLGPGSGNPPRVNPPRGGGPGGAGPGRTGGPGGRGPGLQ
jgi:type II secretory pathway pseudopilin PulG